MSLWSWVGDRFKDAAHGVENAVDWVGDRADDMGAAIQAMYTDNPDAQAMDMAELVQKVKAGYGSADLHECAGVAQGQTASQQQIGDDSHGLVQALESAWQGQASEAAQGSIVPLARSADEASQTLTSNGQNLTMQGEQFDRTKASMADMPSPAPSKSWFTQFSPITTDSERAVDQYNQLAAQNRDVFTGYQSGTQSVQGSTKIDYGTLPDAQNAAVGDFQLTPAAPGRGQRSVSVPNVGGVPAAARSHSMSARSVPSLHDYTAAQSAPGAPPSIGGSAVPAGNAGATQSTGYAGPGGSSDLGSVPGASWDTTRSGRGVRSDGSAGLLAGGLGPLAAGGMSGGEDATAGRGAGGGGFGGARGSGASEGAGSGGRGLAGGRVTGGGEPGGGANAGTAGAAEAARASSGRATSGTTGMGAGKGKGGDDEEHQRASYLVEGDPESLFGTDEKTAPPVIGA